MLQPSASTARANASIFGPASGETKFHVRRARGTPTLGSRGRRAGRFMKNSRARIVGVALQRRSRTRLDLGTKPRKPGRAMNAALEAEGLVKRYGVRTAVRDLSFSVPQGAIYGVLGPNGAGKSTTLRMLVGVLRPSAGRISILGGPVSREVLKRVGYLPEERGLYRAMSARAAIAYLARQIGRASCRERR